MTDSSNPTSLSLLSRILELEFGEARLQHYGLFEDSNSSLIDAQQRFASELASLAKSSAPNSQVLIVGDSLLPLAKSMAEEGYPTGWIGCADQLDSRLEAHTNFRYAGDDFVAASEPAAVDVLIHAGTINYLDQLAILTKSRDLLGEEGRFILFSELLHDDSLIEYSAIPNLSSFEQLSRRLGFQLVLNRDLSSSASRTLELVRPLINKHGDALLEQVAAGPTLLEDLQKEFDTMQAEYSSNRRGFHLCVLERGIAAGYEWADVEFGDMHSFQAIEVADLFERSFGVDFNAALWNWKYVQGGGKCVVARLGKDSEIVAHYGGAPRRIRYFGNASMAIQPCDVMVHPDIRKQYGKGSLFFEVAATFLEREIGNTVNHLLGFGFPNQKTMNISKRLGLYEKTDDFIELVYPLSDISEQQEPVLISDYDPNDSAARAELDSLWEAMAEGYSDGIIGLRDAEYIQHRYIDHPFSKTQQYRCVMLRESDTQKGLAFAVLKEHDGGKLLMDLVCPVASMKTAISILKQELIKEEGAADLRLWLTSSGKDKVMCSGAIVNELGIEIPCNSWNPGPSAQALYGAWWLTAGDMDFI
ncbi:MAG: hypothetical protein DHS20C12_10900 [Pseudohongiella sp.]|nr:MAG: hypothetical protein DHS20C12_10900 [Pseudohongiella sp.]